MNHKKHLFALVMLGGLGVSGYAGNDSDSLGLPGDNLDLYGVLELFKKSSSLEEFEKAINEKNNEVNNLDLNGDDEVDYIRVIDHAENDAHAITLQVPVSETESQDVAVIELEKTGEESAQVQILGDEDLYGKEYIIEPKGDDGTKSLISQRPGVVVNVWVWPSVKFIFGPKYVVWVSPWKWKAYPGWWKPWRPVAWHVHHKRVVRYRVHHHRVHVHRVVHAHKVYNRHRVVSTTVHKRHKMVKANQKQAPGKKHQVKHGPKHAGKKKGR